MLVELGATCAPTDRFDFRYLQQKAFGKQAHLVGVRQRDPRTQQHRDGERPLIERRQE
jgi:hypothetical protein